MKALLAVLAIVAVAYAVDCDPSSIAPMMRTFVAGFDSQKGIWLDLPIWKLTCDKNQHISPRGHSEISWAVPDQAIFYQEADQDERVSWVMAHSESEIYKATYVGFNFGVSVPLKIGTLAFNYSLEYGKIHDQITQKSKIAGYSFHWWKTMSGQMVPTFLLTKDSIFQQAIDMMPTTVSTMDDWNLYIQLLQYYGTHYASQGNFGGMYHVYSFANSSLLATHDERWLSQQFSLSFHMTAFNISPGLFANITDIKKQMDSAYLAGSETDEYYSGGNTNYQRNDTIVQWVDSVVQNPAPLNTTLTYIYKTFTDKAKAANMQKLVEYYEKYGCYPTSMDFAPCKTPTVRRSVPVPQSMIPAFMRKTTVTQRN